MSAPFSFEKQRALIYGAARGIGLRVSCLCPGPVATRVSEGMKRWSADAVMRGPGSQFRLTLPEELATVLADGMRDGRVVIPTHESAFEVMREHAATPDRFLSEKLAAFERGESGLPVIPGAR